ncbi:hypothetical protein Agub_g13453, partial [Astrephomene gubernaculifera]
MAQALLLPGTPARTLALVLAGRPDLVHAAAVQQPPLSPDVLGGGAGGGGGGGGGFVGGSAGSFSGFGPPPPMFGVAAALAPPPPAAHLPPAGFYNPTTSASTTVSGYAGGGGGGGSGGGGGGRGGGMLSCWHEHLSVLLTSRGPVDASEAVVRLGDRLRSEAGQVLAAHLCYSLASCPPALPDSPDCRYSLLGASATALPYMPFADGGAAFKRTEVLEWLLMKQAATAVGATAGAGGGGVTASSSGAAGGATAADAVLVQMAPLLPYKLLYAWSLVEYGKITEALQYCTAIEAALRTGGAAMAAMIAPQQQQQQQQVVGGQQTG